MFISGKIEEIRSVRWRNPGVTWGLVTTMGALHAGHLSLIGRSRHENDFTAATIFVNPTQFNNAEDLAKYPRTLETDSQMLREAGVELLFAPTPEEMYPDGFATGVTVGQLATQLEGSYRPGHFDGVSTVVAKLFNIIQPTRAYFGQKDAQQTIVLKRMVADLNMNLDLIVCPTLREPHGLAMSSRNERLDPTDRQNAAILYQALQHGQHRLETGESNPETIKKEMAQMISQMPNTNIEYISIANQITLEEAKELESFESPLLVSLAVYFGEIRLIDNIIIDLGQIG